MSTFTMLSTWLLKQIVDTYSGRPGWRPTEITTIPFTSAIAESPASTTKPIVNLPSELPLDEGTRDDCYDYFDGADFQDAEAIEGTSWVNQCQRVADLYQVSWDELSLWNGGLANISTAECKFHSGKRYCGMQYFGEPAPKPEAPSYEFPVRVSFWFRNQS